MKITYDNALDYSNETFQRILTAFLFECPVENVSQKAKHLNITFPQKGWGGNTLNSLIAAMKRNVYSSNLEYRMLDNKQDVSNLYEDAERKMATEGKPYEIVVYQKNGGFLCTKSLFYSIRCALAHGDFSIEEDNCGERLYLFRNFNNQTTKACLRLYEKTLFMWIDLLHMDAESLPKAKLICNTPERIAS